VIHVPVQLTSPKIVSKRNRRLQYRYYAGFSPEFVAEILLGVQHGNNRAAILDPWVGGGTTLEAASSLGLRSAGVDANPVMCVVAKSRLFDPDLVDTAVFAQRICNGMSRRTLPLAKCDPLRMWFGDKTSSHVRQLQREICAASKTGADISLESINGLTALACIGLTALFNCCRNLLCDLYSSNPTWFKVAPPARRRGISKHLLLSMFERELDRLAGMPAAGHRAEARVLCSDSRSLPFADASFDAIVSSPPYCTRIDYAIKTTVELACLGSLVFSHFRSIRTKLIGTSAITGERIASKTSWGPTCIEFLDRVRSHYSKASKSYYLRTHLQYFSSLFCSLAEASRVLRVGGSAVLVVQDSYYKEIHNDLARIVTEMCAAVGLILDRADAFEARQTISHINTAGRAYRGKARLTESVLFFSKA